MSLDMAKLSRRAEPIRPANGSRPNSSKVIAAIAGGSSPGTLSGDRRKTTAAETAEYDVQRSCHDYMPHQAGVTLPVPQDRGLPESAEILEPTAVRVNCRPVVFG